MQHVYYKLLKKWAWHCNKCMSELSDNSAIKNQAKERYFLELFSGSKTVSNVFEQYNYKVQTIDIIEKFNPSICADILQLKLNQIPQYKKISVVWASVPCTVNTILNLHNHHEKFLYSHRNYYYLPKTSEALHSIKMLEKTLWLIKKINPVYYFIENPRGAMRHFPQIKSIPFRYCVSYSDYGASVYKPTDIFTNCGFLKLKELKTSVGQKFENSVAKLNDSFQRSIVPSLLVQEILNQIDFSISA